jgi:hypothetical protein
VIEASLAFVTPTDNHGVVITGQEHHRVHEQVISDLFKVITIFVDELFRRRCRWLATFETVIALSLMILLILEQDCVWQLILSNRKARIVSTHAQRMGISSTISIVGLVHFSFFPSVYALSMVSVYNIWRWFVHYVKSGSYRIRRLTEHWRCPS